MLGETRMPTTSFVFGMAIVPALVTELLLSIVTAAVPAAGVVRVIDPAVVMLMSEAAPLLAVDVLTGAVVAVEIETCAMAGRVKTSGAAAPSSRRILNVMRAVNS